MGALSGMLQRLAVCTNSLIFWKASDKIIETMRRIVCTTCERDLPANQFPKQTEGSQCKHDRETCKKCWHQWLDVQVATKGSDQISCAACNVVLGQNEIRALATSAVYEKYLDAELKASLSIDPDFRWCISPTCKSGQIHSEGDIFRCSECGFKACVHCSVAWHEEETCTAYQARMTIQPKHEEDSAEALKKYAKLCPGCTRKLEKNGYVHRSWPFDPRFANNMPADVIT